MAVSEVAEGASVSPNAEGYRSRRTRSRRRGLFRRPGAGVRRASLRIAVLALIGGAVYGSYGVVSRLRSRTIRVCAVTDFAFRYQKPNYDHAIKVWFNEINRVFEPVGFRWDVTLGGDAYPERTEGNLPARRRMIDESNS